VNSLSVATERLAVRAGYLKGLNGRTGRSFARMLGRNELPPRSEFAQLRPGLRLVIVGLAAWIGLVGVVTLTAVVSMEISSISAPGWLRIGALPAAAGPRSQARSEDIWQRPLFSRNRKLIAAAQSVVASPPPQVREQNITLKGVFLDGTTAKAFLTSPEFPFGSWVALNGEIAGWRVASVNPDQVVLGADDEKLVIAVNRTGAPHSGVSATNLGPTPPKIFGPRQNPNRVSVPLGPGEVLQGR
jgi:hypothetical protein